MVLAVMSAVILGCGSGKEPEVQAPMQPGTDIRLTEETGEAVARPDPTTGSLVPGSSVTDDSQPNAPLPGFSWVVPGELAAMPLPGGQRPLNEDAAFLDREGIRVLVSLTEDPPDGAVLATLNIDQLHLPVRDFTAPTTEQIVEFVATVEGSVAKGEPVGVHCTAGLGRSGTMAAAYLVSRGASATEAITKLRQLRPGSIETEAQEAAVRHYEKHLSKIR